jgi:hypothetical protein
VTIEPELVLDQLARRHQWERLEQQVLEQVGHYRLEYERDLRNPHTRITAIEGLLDYLGVPQAELATNLSPSDHRSLTHVVTNLEEILDTVGRSPWSGVLDGFDPEAV